MAERDRLAEVKARRAAAPTDPLEVVDTIQETEFYMRWLILEHGPPDEYGYRERVAFLHHSDAAMAEFIAHASADIDWLVGEVERLREERGAIFRRSNAAFEAKDQRLERANLAFDDQLKDIGKLSREVTRLRDGIRAALDCHTETARRVTLQALLDPPNANEAPQP